MYMEWFLLCAELFAKIALQSYKVPCISWWVVTGGVKIFWWPYIYELFKQLPQQRKLDFAESDQKKAKELLILKANKKMVQDKHSNSCVWVTTTFIKLNTSVKEKNSFIDCDGDNSSVYSAAFCSSNANEGGL